MKQKLLEDLQIVQQTATRLALLDEEVIVKTLKVLARELINNQDKLLIANKEDLAKMSEDNPKFDRLKLTKERILEIAAAIKEIANYPPLIGEVMEKKTLDNELELSKVRVPLGVVGVIFEARPNVFLDCFALCFRAKNVSVLRGSSDALHSNQAIFFLIQKVLEKQAGLKEAVIFVSPEHELLTELLTADQYLDVIIPRGSSQLIKLVRAKSSVPVIETGAGIVHTFIDRDADIWKAKKIIVNAKTSRPSVCNALDCLLVDEQISPSLSDLVQDLAKFEVVIYADSKANNLLKNNYPAKLLRKAKIADFGREFLDFKMAVKIVEDLDAALAHIAQYSSKHSEAIVSQNLEAQERFLKAVDAAAVYVNASTRFTDGAEFGLGAEIGISTQKLHARGPMGLGALTSYKWLVRGEGQTRE